jgi:alanyl-tRNA synthetase
MYATIDFIMKSSEIRRRFLDFFKNPPRNHAIIPSASLVPENDPSVLFNTAGMQPLVPYLLGEKHPAGTRLVNSQKCVRTQDIEEVGDNTHDTFFEMLGNWSLGDYFKEEAIRWSFELLTSKSEGFGLDPNRLYITVFAGNDDAPKDEESFDIWKKYIPENRIYYLGWNGKKEPNWWEAGPNGPCGPDTEMFYDITSEGLGDMTKEEYLKADEDQKVVEIWNDVFMEYVKKDGKVVGTLPKRNVDTGSGLERIVMAIQGKDNIFDTDLFSPIMREIEEQAEAGSKSKSEGATSTDSTIKSKRIVADHIRTSAFMIGDGVTPSNTEQGYILRRLIRRAVRHADKIGMKEGSLFHIADAVFPIYKDVYPELTARKETIKIEIDKEEKKFRQTLQKGMKELEKMSASWRAADTATRTTSEVTVENIFNLYQTYGFPVELTEEILAEKGIRIDRSEINALIERHKELSRAGADQKFKGGLGDTSEMSLRYHTATHLLHQALREVLGDHVSQKGSNITPERLRFDFTHPTKMTDDEKKRVEDIVNAEIDAALPVQVETMSREDAEKTGALHFFGEKYGDSVTVYYVGDSMDTAVSKEFCGGPHVRNTKELAGDSGAMFKIQKEEAVAQGVRRIKAVLE